MPRGMTCHGGAAAAAVVLAVALALATPRPAAAADSKLWGKNGSAWTPAGRLIDFSFAGYHQGNDPLPEPPVTKSVEAFRQPGRSDTDTLLAAVAWANKQQPKTGYTVLKIPAGRYTLTRKLVITSSRVVLRGAGSGKTTLDIPKSLTDIYGPDRSTKTGGYVNWGGFLTIQGRGGIGKIRATATGKAQRGDFTIAVNTATALRVGGMYDLWYTDIQGKLNSIILGANWAAPDRFDDKAITRVTTRVLKIRGNLVTLERALPWPLVPGVSRVTLHEQVKTVVESGVEGVTLLMKWEPYAGHHLERGWNGVELMSVRDCWVRDIEIINPDSGVLLNWQASSCTITAISISYTKTRVNKIPNKWKEDTRSDGHWGLTFGGKCYDILFDGFDIKGKMQHDVGTGYGAQLGVFMNGRMSDGNLDLHRGLSGPSLYTNLDVGVGSKALASGGPPAAGPNAAYGTTWWHITSDKPMSPNRSNGKLGVCAYGPAVNLVGLNLVATQTSGKTWCPTWWYERNPTIPSNLYKAQLALRQKRRRAA